MRDYTDIKKSADLWATEWAVRRRNRRIITCLLAVLLIVGTVMASKAIVILVTRNTFESAEEMKSSVQGRYMCGNFEEIEIKDNIMYITYYNVNEYGDHSEFDTHTNSYLDDTYESNITSWKYRTGDIQGDWTEVYVNRDGNLVYSGRVYEKVEGPRKILRKDADGKWGYKGDTSEDTIDGTQKENNTMEENASEDVEETKEEESLNA